MPGDRRVLQLALLVFLCFCVIAVVGSGAAVSFLFFVVGHFAS
jgi:hypothetical protein